LSPAFIEAIVCNWCTKARPRFRVHRLQSNQVICDYCLDWQQHALDVLGGAPPRGCQGCCKTWAMLSAMTPGDQVRMYVVPKDGIYQLLCAACIKPYLPKTPQLYKGTKFGTDTLKLL
jgi:hypothetical protein